MGRSFPALQPQESSWAPEGSNKMAEEALAQSCGCADAGPGTQEEG